MGSILGIGAGAGFVSALLFAVVTTGKPLAIVLYLIAPLPVLLAALGWNHRAGIAATVAGGAMLSLALTPYAGLLFVTSVAGPAWWFAYLTLLARTDEGVSEWYPLGRLLMWMVAISSTLTLLGALMIGTDYDSFVGGFERAVRLIEQISPATFEGLPPQARGESARDLARLLATIAPPISAAAGVGTSVVLLWIAARVVRASGRLPRPWPAIAETTLPRLGLTVLGASLVASLLLPGFAGLLARAVAAAMLMAYCLQGLAVIHVLTRGVSGRGGILAGVYITFFGLPGWPVLLYALTGITDALFGMRARKLAAGRPPSAPTSPTSSH